MVSDEARRDPLVATATPTIFQWGRLEVGNRLRKIIAATREPSLNCVTPPPATFVPVVMLGVDQLKRRDRAEWQLAL